MPDSPLVTPIMFCRAFVAVFLLVTSAVALAIDLDGLWDFSQPALSESRFRQALMVAEGDDALILQTQIARTYSLRKDFGTARQLLRSLEPAIAAAGPEASVRYHLEWGRSHASATHAPEQLSEQNKALARQAFGAALDAARAAGLDGLAIDAIHMFAFTDRAPSDQLKWAQAALDVVLASSQSDARRWEASVRNNLGLALSRLERHEEALRQFQLALTLREKGTNARAKHVAHWMVAWTLRNLKRTDEALEIQLRLERETAAAGTPDPFVYEELEALYRARGDDAAADRYRRLRAETTKG